MFHVYIPLQSPAVCSSLDNTQLFAEWALFHLHTKVNQALLCTLIICVSIPLLPFLSLSFSLLDMFHFCIEAASWMSKLMPQSALGASPHWPFQPALLTTCLRHKKLSCVIWNAVLSPNHCVDSIESGALSALVTSLVPLRSCRIILWVLPSRTPWVYSITNLSFMFSDNVFPWKQSYV